MTSSINGFSRGMFSTDSFWLVSFVMMSIFLLTVGIYLVLGNDITRETQNAVAIGMLGIGSMFLILTLVGAVTKISNPNNRRSDQKECAAALAGALGDSDDEANKRCSLNKQPNKVAHDGWDDLDEDSRSDEDNYDEKLDHDGFVQDSIKTFRGANPNSKYFPPLLDHRPR